MSNLTNIPQQEVKEIVRNFSADTGLTYNPRHLKTIEDCIEQYNKADEVSHLARAVIKDRMQGDALLKAKKIICKNANQEKEWDSPRLTGKAKKNWGIFLETLHCERSTANKLLDFAGYKEKGGEIETASHYREVKKVAGKDVKDIDIAYTAAGGSDLKTAKEVKEEVSKQKVWVREIFVKEIGELKEKPISPMSFPLAVMAGLPSVTIESWKSFYRTAANCVHPDKGGSQSDMSILASLNEVMSLVILQAKRIEDERAYEADYKIWKEDRGYKDDFVKEEEL